MGDQANKIKPKSSIMKKTVIESSDESINSTAEMLRIKAGFTEMGIKTFPKEHIKKLCPFRNYDQADKWMTSAQGVWHLRNNDEQIIKAFKKALKNAVNEIEVQPETI